MTPTAPGICPWCKRRHETCLECGGETGCDDDGNATCATCDGECDGDD